MSFDTQDPEKQAIIDTIQKYIPGVVKKGQTFIIPPDQIETVENYLRMFRNPEKLGVTSKIALSIFNKLPEYFKEIPRVQVAENHTLNIIFHKFDHLSKTYTGFNAIHGFITQELGLREGYVASFYEINKLWLFKILLNNNRLSLADLAPILLIGKYNPILGLNLLEELFVNVQKTQSTGISFYSPTPRADIGADIAVIKKAYNMTLESGLKNPQIKDALGNIANNSKLAEKESVLDRIRNWSL